MNSKAYAQNIFVLVVVLVSLVHAKSILIPLAVSMLIWMLIDALKVRLSRMQIAGRALPKYAIPVLSTGVITCMMAVLYIIFANQADNFVEVLPVYEAKFTEKVHIISGMLGIQVDNAIATMYDSIDFTAIIAGVANSTGTMIANIVLVAIYVAFMLVEQSNSQSKIRALAASYSEFGTYQQIFHDSIAVIRRYIWLKSVVSALTAICSYAVLKYMEVEFAELWAVLVFFLNFIPNIGSFLGVICPSLMALLQFDSLTPIVMVVGSLGFIQFFLGNVFEPAYMGKSLNLSALMILLSLSFWGMIWGVAGMFLAVPMMVATAVIFSHIDSTRWIAIIMSSDGSLLTEDRT